MLLSLPIVWHHTVVLLAKSWRLDGRVQASAYGAYGGYGVQQGQSGENNAELMFCSQLWSYLLQSVMDMQVKITRGSATKCRWPRQGNARSSKMWFPNDLLCFDLKAITQVLHQNEMICKFGPWGFTIATKSLYQHHCCQSFFWIERTSLKS